jgi:NADH dehydrogenase [ubiquinone] 1 alpha subcomplex assembly factor 7
MAHVARQITPLGSGAASLADELAAAIARDGPIGVARYMHAALQDPRFGYYTRRDPLGAAGDFITAPEISQMFGEIMGLWFADLWRRQGSPAPARLVELGPGRGTLMADLLRAARAMPGFRAATALHLIETSPVLRAKQAWKLADNLPEWHERFDQVPAGPVFVMANEFFDALPVHQLVRADDGWRERLVENDGKGGFRFTHGASPTPLANYLPPRAAMAPPGAIAEVGLEGRHLMSEIAARVARHGGGALIVDYGPAGDSLGDSLQAVKGHRPHPVLSDPGTADITAHVDFAALAEAARAAGAEVFGPAPQGEFLRRLGLELRAQALKTKASAAEAQAIDAAARRLTAPEAMGRSFKVLAVAPPGAIQLPGFHD